MSETVDLLRFQYTVAKDTPTFTDEVREMGVVVVVRMK